MRLDEDGELIRSIAAGSAEALGALYDRYAALVFGLARRVTGRVEDAEEVVQDVFTQVWRQAARYEVGRATVAGWLVMLARTRAIDRGRSRWARPDQTSAVEPGSVPVLVAHDPTPEAVVVSADEALRVRQALVELPENQRDLVELAYYDGLTHVEIAERTGVALGTVKTRIRSAMVALRGALVSSADPEVKRRTLLDT